MAVKLLFILLSVRSVWANNQVGVITQMQGLVELLNNDISDSTQPKVLFEGSKYTIRPARRGDHVDLNDVIKTGPDGKVRLVFTNGDHFVVGPSTAYKVTISGKEKTSSATVQVLYGKFRSIISKEGPRSGMQVKTPAAVMGVRGTDFFVESNGHATKVTVLRGEVSVRSTLPKVPAAIVKSGFITEVNSTTAAAGNAPSMVSEVRKTTQVELAQIQNSSHVEIAMAKEPEIKPEEAKKIEMLEEKASETTLKDIKKYDPELFKELTEKKAVSVNDINAATVGKLFRDAPPPTQNSKPKDLEDIKEDVYKKFFKGH